MMKTITLMVLAVSASANALAAPVPVKGQPKYTKICLTVGKHPDGSRAASCDARARNAEDKVKLLQNGCAKDQIAMTVVGDAMPVDSCLPPGMVQL